MLPYDDRIGKNYSQKKSKTICMQCFVRKLQTQEKNIKPSGDKRLVWPLTLSTNSKRVRSYKGACLSADKSTLLIKLDVRILTDALRNVYVCIVDGMLLEQCHVDLHSTFGGVANVTPPVLLRRANPVDFTCDTYKYYQLMILPEKIMFLVLGEVNVSGHKQRMPKDMIIHANQTSMCIYPHQN